MYFLSANSITFLFHVQNKNNLTKFEFRNQSTFTDLNNNVVIKLIIYYKITQIIITSQT